MKKSSAQRKQEALDAFMAHKGKIDTILTRLQEASEDHFDTHPDHITWGDTAFLADIGAQLEQISDRIFKEGEFSPNNQG